MPASAVSTLPYLDIVISGIVVLAAANDRLPVSKIHETFYAVRPHEGMLAGLRFSITGAVCYSTQVDLVLRQLDTRGIIRLGNGCATVVGKPDAWLNSVAGIVPEPQLREIRSASDLFHRKLREALFGGVAGGP